MFDCGGGIFALSSQAGNPSILFDRGGDCVPNRVRIKTTKMINNIIAPGPTITTNIQYFFPLPEGILFLSTRTIPFPSGLEHICEVIHELVLHSSAAPLMPLFLRTLNFQHVKSRSRNGLKFEQVVPGFAEQSLHSKSWKRAVFSHPRPQLSNR